MRTRAALCLAAPLVAVLVCAPPASATLAPRWSDQELTGFASLVVTGRVAAVTGGVDRAVDTIYTYVAVDVDDVLKGVLPDRRIVLKQIGGVAGALGLHVGGQPRFAPGEDVLLFLSVRPRDRTLQTTALWQGKWRVTRAGGVAIAAERADPEQRGAAVERRPFAALEGVVRDHARAAGPPPADFRAVPPETPAFAEGDGTAFTLFDPAWRWTESPMPVDYEIELQPGLPGGGLAELAATLARWNGVGGSQQLQLGGARAARCITSFEGAGRTSIGFMDDCGEIPADGTLAFGGAYYSADDVLVVNGTPFRQALDGFVVNNDSDRAVEYLTRSGCFQDIELHELGHVLGLGHSTVEGAVMRSFINGSCVDGPHELSPDDRLGFLSVYPPGGVPGTPANVRAQVDGATTVTVSWAPPVGGAAPTGYRVDFLATSGGDAVVSLGAVEPALVVQIPTGTTGTFYASVVAMAAGSSGIRSTPVAFTIDSGGACTGAPAAPTGLSGGVSGGLASASWLPVAGATSYIIQVGAEPGGTEMVNASVGSVTSASAAVPPGFSAYVQVRAVNACGVSAASESIHVGSSAPGT